jgi:hypothetical protein
MIQDAANHSDGQLANSRRSRCWRRKSGAHWLESCRVVLGGQNSLRWIEACSLQPAECGKKYKKKRWKKKRWKKKDKQCQEETTIGTIMRCTSQLTLAHSSNACKWMDREPGAWCRSGPGDVMQRSRPGYCIQRLYCIAYCRERSHNKAQS